MDPPEAIRVHLGQEHWYLRDSNWDPDFTQSAPRIAWFFEKEMDERVDGVVAVDLSFAKKLLEVTGPLEVIDYDQAVTPDNLFTTAYEQVETNFFPGSTQKKDFLGAVGRALEEAIISGSTNKTALLQKLHEAVMEKHMLVYFSNPLLQRVASQSEWSGGLMLPVCGECINDFVSIIDANLGVNKVNYYVTRKLNDTVTIDEKGQINHTLVINYKNSSPENDTKASGAYKNYVRILLPAEAKLTAASIDEAPLELGSGTLASSSSVISQTVGDKTVVSHLIEVPPQQAQALTLSYALETSDLEAKPLYQYQIVKQPGTEADPFDLTVVYPASWQAMTTDEKKASVAGATTLVRESQITYNTTLSQDRVFKMKFSR